MALQLPLLLLLVAAIHHATSVPTSNNHILKLREDFVLTTQSGEIIVDLVGHLKTKGQSTDCSSGDKTCRVWTDGTKITISTKDERCKRVDLNATVNDVLVQCFPLGDNHWFGGPEQKNQKWPLEQFVYDDLPMVTRELGNQAIADPFWFNSNGTSIFVERGAPLFIDQNNRKKQNFCLVSKIMPPYRSRPSNRLVYHVCRSENAKEAFMHGVKNFLGHPQGDLPNENMVRYPIWSTWAKYKAAINQTIVLDFAEEILRHGYPNGQLEIDDSWETCYGSATFDTKRFPNIKNLTDSLKKWRYRVTLWTHPFINMECQDHKTAEDLGFLVRNDTGTESHWWNGKGSNVDFTKKDAREWYSNRLQRMLADSGIDGLKFDAGETSWMPNSPHLNIKMATDEEYPMQLTSDYVRTCAKFGPLTEVRSAYRTQDLPIFVRMIDKDSKWGYNNGLRTLVTTLLQMNMVGYSLVLPDMVGGNQYPPDVASEELFIRWMQANTFMPSIQFSLVPWDFSKQANDISKKYVRLHTRFADNILKLMKRNSETGEPINPPIWWMDPTDKTALGIDSEYMLGEEILVAPVMEEGAASRDIYLPRGSWWDENIGKRYVGPLWLNNYPAPIDVLPYFIKEADEPTLPPPKPSRAHSVATNVSLLVLSLLPIVMRV